MSTKPKLPTPVEEENEEEENRWTEEWKEEENAEDRGEGIWEADEYDEQESPDGTTT
ncbi:hypothetical protein BaRGS_00038958, partial [Batillaria attramentaria]